MGVKEIGVRGVIIGVIVGVLIMGFLGKFCFFIDVVEIVMRVIINNVLDILNFFMVIIYVIMIEI